MMCLRLVRISELEGATLGVLILDKRPLWKTLELPWLDNSPMISCIPPGEYEAIKYSSPKFGRVLYVQNVPGRSEILLHVGNSTLDTYGCILPGMTFGTMNGKPAVYESRKAMERILDALRNEDRVKLQIVSAIN